MRAIRSLALLGALAPVALLAAEPAAPDCPDILPDRAAAATPRRSVTPEDLVRLRDIGPAGPSGEGGALLGLSPDGRRIAFQVRRADPERNTYCLALLVLDLRPGSMPRIVDQGGELIRRTFDLRGMAGFPTGIPLPVTPRWSPDGHWIAFLKREQGVTRIWRAEADGSASRPLPTGPDDVEDFRLAPDGTSITFTVRPGLRLARAAIAQEGRSGFHYDERFSPMSSDIPFPPAPIPSETRVLDLASGEVRPAGVAEAALMTSPADPPGGGVASAPSALRAWLWIEGRDPLAPDASILKAQLPGHGTAACPASACGGARLPWWSGDGRIRFLRREGWARASTAIHEWDPRTGSVQRLYETEDLLADCVPSGEDLVCLRETSLQPRRLERLDLRSGQWALLFDPNPEFATLELGAAERLHWRNDIGLEVIGDLILPVGYRSGRRYPLIVIQYHTRGFLRGGTGDEYPIQAFAGRGHAVLSVNRTLHVGLAQGLRNEIEVERANLAGFADRRSTLSSVETGVRHLIARGIADPERIGITGFSDGASTATFALINTSLFSAAAMSNCCIDTTLPTRVGPGAAREFRAVGYPRLIDRAETFWSRISISRNARRIRVPILLQLADSEYMSALESFTALREAGAPADMYVFPGEYHVKWQPAHRLAVYRRALDWFDFWLRGLRPRDPARQSELAHWDSLSHDAGQPAID
ncbi:Atxe2 family lasso peptide isopeptidase [Sphingosinicella terrae]|uniref:Atxe2 family lasso peptide isopeptidase n=1 Tax=Sphingosinicella terrae TaxID=2172047 RepID=UPI000E0DB2CE|nr:Atxe2 family lasso peptide isopeptidase [Sphingosinicella terrae]